MMGYTIPSPHHSITPPWLLPAIRGILGVLYRIVPAPERQPAAANPQSPIPKTSVKACLQRVARAQVTVAGQRSGQIGRGLVVLLGVAAGDTEDDARRLAEKIVALRIFEDAEGKMNLGLSDVGGAMLVVSQFTLLADCRKGRRPSFTAAAPPELAESLYETFADCVRQQGIPTATGRFQQHMLVELVNDGPVTILLDTEELNRPRRQKSEE